MSRVRVEEAYAPGAPNPVFEVSVDYEVVGSASSLKRAEALACVVRRAIQRNPHTLSRVRMMLKDSLMDLRFKDMSFNAQEWRYAELNGFLRGLFYSDFLSGDEWERLCDLAHSARDYGWSRILFTEPKGTA